MLDAKQFSSDKILTHLDKIWEWLQTGISQPITYELDMTNICNHKCPHCFGFYNREDRSNLGLQEAQSIIYQIKEFGGRGLIFTGGGEPLCNPDVIEAVEYAKKVGLDIGFISNGMLIDEEIAKSLLGNCTWVRISLDAASAQMFRATHGVDGVAFEQIIENIKLLVRMKKKLNSSCTIGAGYLTSQHTKEGINKFALLCRDLGVNYAQFRPLLPSFGKERIDYMSRIQRDIIREIKRSLKLSGDGYEVLHSKHKYDSMVNGEIIRSYGKCYGHHFATVIAADAKMYVCFTGETQLLIRHGNIIRYLPIRNLKDIEINNTECILNGEFFKIKRLLARQCKEKGELITITMDNGVKLRVTEEHPVFTNEGIKEARELTGEEKLPFATKPYETNCGNYELGRFIGFYLSEGFMMNRYITFTFSEKEEEYISFVCAFVRKSFGVNYKIYKKPQYHCISIQISDKGIKGLINTFVGGRTSDEKHLLSKCFAQGIDFRKGLVDGIYQGDGDLRTNELHLGSRQLVKDICCILSTLGYPCSFRVCNKGKSFKVRILKKPAEANLTKGGRTKYEQIGEFFWVGIKKIVKPRPSRAKIKYKINKKVYDIEIDSKNHLFQLANGLVVHNCCHTRGYDKYCIGDLKKNSIKEIWRSVARKKVYENINLEECVPLCRCNTFNTVLWSIKQEKIHKNFI